MKNIQGWHIKLLGVSPFPLTKPGQGVFGILYLSGNWGIITLRQKVSLEHRHQQGCCIISEDLFTMFLFQMMLILVLQQRTGNSDQYLEFLGATKMCHLLYMQSVGKCSTKMCQISAITFVKSMGKDRANAAFCVTLTLGSSLWREQVKKGSERFLKDRLTVSMTRLGASGFS